MPRKPQIDLPQVRLALDYLQDCGAFRPGMRGSREVSRIYARVKKEAASRYQKWHPKRRSRDSYGGV